jgi:hypothetical protein
MTASAPDHSVAPEFSYGFGLYLLFRLFPDTKNTQDHGGAHWLSRQPSWQQTNIDSRSKKCTSSMAATGVKQSDCPFKACFP